jgi:hypothetical protein
MFTGLIRPSGQMPEHCLKEGHDRLLSRGFQLIHHFSSHNLRSRNLPHNFVSKFYTRVFNGQKIRNIEYTIYNIHLSQRCCCFEFTNKTTGGSIDLSKRTRFLWPRWHWKLFKKFMKFWNSTLHSHAWQKLNFFLTFEFLTIVLVFVFSGIWRRGDL